VTRIIRIEPNDRLFDPLFKFLVIQSSFTIACAVIIGQEVHARSNHEMDCHVLDLTVRLPLRKAMQLAIDERTPSVIEFELRPKAELQGRKAAEVGTFLPYLVTPILVEFVEAHKQWLFDRYDDWRKFPPTAAFAYQVRNSIAHLGVRIHGAGAVSWYGLSYSAADNGRPVIGHDLSTADVLVLMLEFSKELDEAGCPPPSDLAS